MTLAIGNDLVATPLVAGTDPTRDLKLLKLKDPKPAEGATPIEWADTKDLPTGTFLSESRPLPGWQERFPGLIDERPVMFALPTGVIVHLRDWHAAPDHRDEKHLGYVEAVLAGQVELLHELLRRGYRTVEVEGLTPSGMNA